MQMKKDKKKKREKLPPPQPQPPKVIEQKSPDTPVEDVKEDKPEPQEKKREFWYFP
jgi:hypothetical protein